MKNISDLFVPYELALLAKEKGFNEPTLAYYNDDKELIVKVGWEKEYKDLYYLVAAPVYQQLIDWFRNKHRLHLMMRLNGDWCSTELFRLKDNNISQWLNDKAGYGYYVQFDKLIEHAFKII